MVIVTGGGVDEDEEEMERPKSGPNMLQQITISYTPKLLNFCPSPQQFYR